MGGRIHVSLWWLWMHQRGETGFHNGSAALISLNERMNAMLLCFCLPVACSTPWYFPRRLAMQILVQGILQASSTKHSTSYRTPPPLYTTFLSSPAISFHFFLLSSEAHLSFFRAHLASRFSCLLSLPSSSHSLLSSLTTPTILS